MQMAMQHKLETHVSTMWCECECECECEPESECGKWLGPCTDRCEYECHRVSQALSHLITN